MRRVPQITAGLASIALAAALAAPAQAAPEYRQLDGTALAATLPAASEVPPWLGAVQEVRGQPYVPEEGIPICFVLSDPEPTDILGRKAPLAAYSLVLFERDRGALVLQNLVMRIFQFPDRASADAAWADLLAQDRQCAGDGRIDWQYSDTAVLGEGRWAASVRRGDVQFGARSVVIQTRASWIRTGASTPEQTSGTIQIWRRVGNVLTLVDLGKRVRGSVRSALSSSDQATANAVSLLIGERYQAAAAP